MDLVGDGGTLFTHSESGGGRLVSRLQQFLATVSGCWNEGWDSLFCVDNKNNLSRVLYRVILHRRQRSVPRPNGVRCVGGSTDGHLALNVYKIYE